MSTDITPEEIEDYLRNGIREGIYEATPEDGGEVRFKLTDYGSAEAMQTIATNGLPFLVYIISVNAIKDGKLDRTVKSMSDEAIKNFPNKLKRLAKQNFAPFWSEFGSISPADYVAGYKEAEDSEND